MNTRPLLTIAIPTYNGARTICNLLDRLLPQCTEEIELLISNNCSTDRTSEIVSDYQKRFPFIKHVNNKKNIGPDANFLQCMNLAQGEFVWLVSDDDVVIEDSVPSILHYLRTYPDAGLVYVTTVDFRGHYENVSQCTFHRVRASEDIYTCDKKVFMKYASDYWGFISSFICKTDTVKNIKEPERFFGTYWLQSYIHALCAKGEKTGIGIIKKPCTAAGIYVNTAAFDSAKVNGVYYKKLLDFMVEEAGFDQQQLERLYIWRLCHLSRHDILKEKAAGVHHLDKKTLFQCTKTYCEAWLTVYPLFLVPDFLCRFAMRLYRRHLNIKDTIRVNRPEQE